MNLYIGIDLGTSAMKLILMDNNGQILNTVTKEYPLHFPKPSWSEQNPLDWKDALFNGIPELLENHNPQDVNGIGVGGQMHGLVILDSQDNVIRPAILWNDARTSKEVDYLNNTIGKDKLTQYTANIAFAGFTAPKLLWIKENEPETFSKISKIMLPKDYINYILTGEHRCDYSDASGMLLLDVKNKCWSKEMLEICDVKESQMPLLNESYDKIGSVKSDIAEKFCFKKDVTVAGGAGDNAAAAIGTGVIGDGGCNISLGTSGTIFISSKEFKVDSHNALHAFAHADGGYHLMACMLSAASCNKWLMNEIYKTNSYAEEEAKISDEKLGNNDVFFLPYLMGERSPINDTNARGTFVGMTMNTTREDMTQAMLEGVAFAIRDSFEIAKSLGIKINSSKICGGGAKSKIWKKIIANVLNIELQCLESEQGPGMGGAMLAMVASGEYESVDDVCNKFVKVSSTIEPNERLVELYNQKYNKFKQIYPTMKNLFLNLNS